MTFQPVHAETSGFSMMEPRPTLATLFENTSIEFILIAGPVEADQLNDRRCKTSILANGMNFEHLR